MLSIAQSLGIIVLVLLSVAFFSLFERKILASVQLRKGPNKVGVFGVFQPFSDAIKLVTKVETFPLNSAKLVYSLSPLVMMSLSTVIWITFPVSFGFFGSGVGMLLILIYFSVSVYGVVFSGWGSNSRFATLGCVRSISQSISYEIGLSFVILTLLLVNSTFSMEEVVKNQENTFFAFLFPPLFVCTLLFLFAETSRPPFDLPEGESELVSGFNVEYGGGKYTIIFLGENLATLWSMFFVSQMFTSGFGLILYITLNVFIRSMTPRMRFDKVMIFFWVTMLPLVLSMGIYPMLL